MVITNTKKSLGFNQVEIFPTEKKANEFIKNNPGSYPVSEKEAKKLNSDCLLHYQDKKGNWCYSLYKTRAAIKFLTKKDVC